MTNQIVSNEDFVITLFVIIDDLLKIINRFFLKTSNKAKKGRKITFSDSEIIVLIMLRWKSSVTSWKSFYYEIYPYYYVCFQKNVAYKNFIALVHRVLPLFLKVINLLNFLATGKSKELFFIDSTPIEVCKIKRASVIKFVD